MHNTITSRLPQNAYRIPNIGGECPGGFVLGSMCPEGRLSVGGQCPEGRMSEGECSDTDAGVGVRVHYSNVTGSYLCEKPTSMQ